MFGRKQRQIDHLTRLYDQECVRAYEAQRLCQVRLDTINGLQAYRDKIQAELAGALTALVHRDDAVKREKLHVEKLNSVASELEGEIEGWRRAVLEANERITNLSVELSQADAYSGLLVMTIQQYLKQPVGRKGYASARKGLEGAVA